MTQYHIVGIAGAGMSAIAHILLDQGHTVSGSDLTANRQTDVLAARGARLAVGHAADHVSGADALLATAAVPPDHVELAAARAASIPVLQRDDLWREWSQQRDIVAVAGTHGKTTTTAMIAWIFERAGCNAGFLIGSESPDLGISARWGDPSAPLVIEADEYNRAFLALTPQVAVVTNVEWDHPDIYPSADSYHAAFAAFAAHTRRLIITCGDGGVGHWAQLARQQGVPVMTYGLDSGNDYRAVLPDAPEAAGFGVWRAKTVPLLVDHVGDVQPETATRYRLVLPGRHNIQNALAAIAVAEASGLDSAPIAAALGTFRGTARRFEVRGEQAGITVVDDYAHHPTEVRATLAAARSHYGQRRLVAYLQPHTYSRTRVLLDDWPAAFADADVVLVGAIYAAREQDNDGAHERAAHELTERIAAQHPDVAYVGSVAEAAAAAQRVVQPGDVLLTLGAGDGNQVGEQLLRALADGASKR